jgi:hypothetical protein
VSLAPALLLLTLPAGTPAPPTPLQVKASPAVARCVESVRALYERSSGRGFVLVVGPLERTDSAAGADVVVGVEEELTRILEGGIAHPEADEPVARIPWVLVGAGRDASALDRTSRRVSVLGGLVGLEARRRLQHLPAERVRRVEPRSATEPVRVEPGELAVVPLSLADPAEEVATLSLPPLEVRVLGVRKSPHLEAARGLVAFLAGGGNAAFCECGRPPR